MQRRTALQLMAAAVPSLRAKALVFEPTWDSLKQYRCPDWFRDAKFGIWAHWGPQCVPKQGDWYARNMYIEGSAQYKYHVAHYGHPSQFGYKDIIQLWKAENWDPESLIRRYKQAGAKYFVALGSHCDNFDCWNSKYHRWNSVNYGPKKDIVGLWGKAARKAGLRFGVTEHMGWTYSWFNVNKGHDKKGPYAGVPYDGNDPKYQDLYLEPHEENAAQYPVNPPASWKQEWLNRVQDLVDQYQPDSLYTDGGIPFGEYGLRQAAHYYNQSVREHHGKLEAVYTIKQTNDPKKHGDYQDGCAVLDMERGLVPEIRPDPWQCDTCIGGWYYHEGIQYKTAETVVGMLIDVVSKNGNMLLNFPLQPDGTLDREEDEVLDDITRWMAVNSQAIYYTRPWKTHGEGPTTVAGGMFSERKLQSFTARDIRFTTKGDALFAFVMAWPDSDVRIQSLGPKKIRRVTLLGSPEKIRWSREGESLLIQKPLQKPCNYAITFKIT